MRAIRAAPVCEIRHTRTRLHQCVGSERVGRRMHPHSNRQRWVLLVTEGLMVAYPPELYAERAVAERECERWAWLLAAKLQTAVERPFEGRWEIGEHWVRLGPG